MSKTATDGRRAAASCPETAIEGETHEHQAGAVVITGVSKVVVPVEDQERALEFWTEPMGFELRRDEAYDGGRWIEVSPPSGWPLLILSPRAPGESKRAAPDELPHSPVFFACADIEATYRELSRRGVVFPVPPRRQDFGWWSLFEDPDGTRYALSQWA